MAHNTPQKDFEASASGTDTVYFSAYPRYDAVRVEFDGTGSADADVTYYIDTNDEVDEVESAGTGEMTAVGTTEALDPSAGDHDGTTAVGRTIAVEVSEQGTASAAAGTVYLHESSDSAESAEAFASR